MTAAAGDRPAETTRQAVYFELPRGRVYGMAAGEPSRPAVIGLHGWSQRNGWQTWEPLLRPLADAGFYVVSLDMPGWGQSAAWSKGPLGDALAQEAVLGVIGALEAKTVALLGKSWGGGVAIQVATAKPEVVSALVLSAPAVGSAADAGGLRQPVLLAWAEDDPVIPFAYAGPLGARIPRCELVTYASGGHSAAVHNAADSGPRAAAFLKRHHG